MSGQDAWLRAGAEAAKLLAERQQLDPLWTWEPFAPQREFLEAPEGEAWYLGANRTGKSDCLAALIASMARNGNMNPRPAYAGQGTYIYDRAIAAWAVSLTFPMSREILQPKIFDNQHVPPGQPHQPFIPPYEIKQWNQTTSTLSLKNGSIIVFKSADQGQSALQGAGRDLVAFDEAPPQIVYNECAIRIEAGRKLFIRGAATLLPPEGVVGGVSWLYNAKIKPWQSGQRPKELRLVGASIYDNPHMAREEIDRLEAIYPPGSVDRAIRLQGLWLPQVVGATAYGAFRSEIHVNPVLSREKHLNYHLPLLLAFDSNAAPCCATVWQQHGRLYRCFDELIIERGGIAELGREFRRRFPHHGAELAIYGDATSKRTTAQTAQSDYDVLMNELQGLPYPISLNLPTVNPPVRDRVNAANFLLRGINGEVRVEIAPHCKELIEDFETVLLDKHGGIKKVHDRKDPYWRRTHTSDGAGYMIVFREPVGSVEAMRGPNASARMSAPLRVPSAGYAFAR